MRHRLICLCLAASLLLCAPQAHATDAKNRYLILGPGSNACAVFLADLKQGEKLNNQAAVVIYSNWLAGSLTAYNRDTRNTYSILGELDFKDAFAWTISYCNTHPASIYAAAADAFIHEYYDDRDISPED